MKLDVRIYKGKRVVLVPEPMYNKLVKSAEDGTSLDLALGTSAGSVEFGSSTRREKNKHTHWTEDQKKYIKEHYMSEGSKACAEYCKRPVSAVSKMASVLGVAKGHNPRMYTHPASPTTPTTSSES